MKRHIQVVDYDTQWPVLFNREKERILEILGTNCICVHHIGSTAVPGIRAKPTIDILPVVHNLEAVDLVAGRFKEDGYEFLGEYGIAGRRYLRKSAGERDLFHLHIFAQSSTKEINRHVAVRDYLCAFAHKAAEYAALKTALAQEFSYDNDGYCDGKDDFVQQLEQDALLWASEQEQKQRQETSKQPPSYC